MTFTPPLIGLTGYAGSGKDTARAILQTIGYQGFAFADPIRAMLYSLLQSGGIDDKYIESREFKEATIPELGCSYRQLAQTLGTEWGRSIHADFWLRLAGAHMAELQHQYEAQRELDEAQGIKAMRPAPYFVISDVRFPNEADWVRERGGLVFRIDREVVTPVRAHASESEIDRITPDKVIDNNGALVDLGRALFTAIGAL